LESVDAVPMFLRPGRGQAGSLLIRAFRWACRVIATAFACTAVLGSVPTATQGADESSPDTQHRTIVDANTYPWSAVGAIFNSDHTECTAVAIAPDQILTAAHCLYGRRTGYLIAPGSLHVLMGFVRGAYAVDATVRDYHVAAGYDHNRPINARNADWAALSLNSPLPSGRGALALAKRIPEAGTMVTAGGYGRDRPFMMTADPECRILGVAATGVLLSDCRFAPGYSGGPLLARPSGGDKMEVVGINIGMSIKGAAQVAAAVPTPLIRWELETVGPQP
jgi:protease YdgD